jgi:hypothetical protein
VISSSLEPPRAAPRGRADGSAARPARRETANAGCRLAAATTNMCSPGAACLSLARRTRRGRRTRPGAPGTRAARRRARARRGSRSRGRLRPRCTALFTAGTLVPTGFAVSRAENPAASRRIQPRALARRQVLDCHQERDLERLPRDGGLVRRVRHCSPGVPWDTLRLTSRQVSSLAASSCAACCATGTASAPSSRRTGASSRPARSRTTWATRRALLAS